MSLRAVAVLALIAGCYDVPTPVCGFSCLQEGECPDGYTCQRLGDGFCHLNGFDGQTCPGHEGQHFDNEPPFVVQISPDQSSPLDPAALIIVRFSENVSGVNANSFFVTQDSTGVTLPASVGPLGSFNWELQPFSGFAFDQSFTVTLTSAIEDAANNPLGQVSFSYFTQSPAPPMLQGSTPNGSELGVSVGVLLQLFFDEAAPNIASKFHVSDSLGTPVVLNIDPASEAQSPFFNLRWQLAPITQYFATIDAGLADIGGHATTSSTVFSFTTGLDNVGPRVWGRTPGFFATAVPVSTSIEIDFDEDAQNVVDGSIVLQKSGVVVPSKLTYNAASKSATLRPDNQLDGFTEYDVVVTTSITDMFGNPALDGGSRFQTDMDRIAPRIRSTIPTTNASAAAVDTPIVITFDEPTFGLDASTLIVTGEPSTSITGTLAATNGNRTWTFTPDAPLPAMTTIDVAVELAQDALGNATSYFYFFSTAP